MQIIKPLTRNPGDKVAIDEEKIVNLSFNIYKNNIKEKPLDSKDIIIFSCFNEFGCETLGIQYIVPYFKNLYKDKYIIVAGWYGREYFYRHLADEFWELKKDFQWLREYCRAFHHDSKHLKLLEKEMRKSGYLMTSSNMGRMAISYKCPDCGFNWHYTYKSVTCPKCKSHNVRKALFGEIDYWRNKIEKIPLPSKEYLEKAETFLKENSVGVFARGRKCYGRNLDKEFYTKLVNLLREKGYNPVWLGEESTTQKCPVDDVVDFSRMEEAKDLELTLAIISKCKFTLQYWTASTRLASMVGVPYILFESPDQIWGHGQEGIRRELCDFGNNKLVAADFNIVNNNNDLGLHYTNLAIEQLENKDFNDLIGPVASKESSDSMRKSYMEKNSLEQR